MKSSASQMKCKIYPAVNPKTLSNLGDYLCLPEKRLRLFLSLSSREETIWLLGAGASYGLRPLWSDLRTVLVRESMSLPLYPVEPAAHTGFRQKVLQPERAHTRLEWAKLRHAPESFLRVAYESLLLGDKDPLRPPVEYSFFRFVPKTSLIMTTNQDGLLHDSVPSHRVLCVHGCAYEAVGFARSFRQAKQIAVDLMPSRVEVATDWGIDSIEFPLYLPGDVLPKELLSRVDHAARYLAAARAFVVIGYSFSDAHILEMLTDVMGRRKSPCQIVLINPDLKNLIGLARSLQDSWSTRDVWPIPLAWNSVAAAIARVAFRYGIASLAKLEAHAEEVLLELQVETNKFPLIT